MGVRGWVTTDFFVGGDTCSNNNDSSSSRIRFLGLCELELGVVASALWDTTAATNLTKISPGGSATYRLVRQLEE